MALTIIKLGHFPMPDSLLAGLKERGEVYFDADLPEKERKAVRARADYAIGSGGSRFQREDFESCPNLKGIICFSVGYDGIDVSEAINRNVILTHTPDVLSDDVANTAMMLMLNCTRQFKAAQEYVEAGNWGKTEDFPLTTSIGEKKLGIAGLGRIGKEIAARSAAFKMEIGYYGRHQHDDVDYQYFNNIKDLAAWCDILMLIMPASPENKHCVNMDVLKALGKDGFLVNVARGSIVATDDLITALDQGVIKGAALDVFEQEPNVPGALMHRPNVALLPHLGSATNETRQKMANLVLQNLDAAINGVPLITPVPGTRKQ